MNIQNKSKYCNEITKLSSVSAKPKNWYFIFNHAILISVFDDLCKEDITYMYII